MRRPTENILAYGAWTPVALACAYLNHDPIDSALHQLAAPPALPHAPRWPGPSAPALDESHYRRALGDLFYGPYPKMGADWITRASLSMLDKYRIGTFSH